MSSVIKRKYNPTLKSSSENLVQSKPPEEQKTQIPKFHDKENNNVHFNSVSSNGSKTPLKTKLLVEKRKTFKDDVQSSDNSGLKCNADKQSSPSRPKQRPSLAASYLSKTADGLAKNHKRNPVINKKLEKTSKIPGKSSPVTTPTKDHYCSPTQHNFHDANRVQAVDKYFGVSSPTVAKIPTHIVRQRVDTIQTPRMSPKLLKQNGDVRSVGTIRKSLAGVFEQHKSGLVSRKSSAKTIEEIAAEDFSVTVAVRVRPFNQRETNLNAKQVVFMNGNETLVSDGQSEHSFIYDHSFWSSDKELGEFASQLTVYEKLGHPLLNAAFEGYNTCLFAYGQTGSGKSYTIMGLGEDKGIVPRFCDEMFASIRSKEKKQANTRYHVQVSYFEIYNEKIHDLLVSSSTSSDATKQVLRVREHPELGPYVEGLSKFTVSSYDDIQAWIEVGNRQRATASTGMNDKSSRSHSVFTMNLVQTTSEELEGEQHESNCRSLINLVDLAGSERSRTAGTSGQRLKEGASINKSLLTLGKVISSLSERSQLPAKKRKRLFIPYRDSTLTWILRESLGGNSRTAMIATISPASCHTDETLSTLRYAKQASTIVNLVKINEDPNARVIRELKAEIAKLKEAYGQRKIDPSEYETSLLEVNALRQQLTAAQKENAQVQAKWIKKLEQSEKRKAEEINELKRAGVSFKVDNQLPNFVNLNEDPQLSELLLYVIKRGVTRVGSKGGDCDIPLSGALIAPSHCELSNVDDVVTIEPIKDAKTFVNGELITKREILHHGDRVIIGGDHFFRLNNPIEIQRNGKKRNSGGKRKDFEFAKLELIERQNERLQREIHDAQLKVKKEMLGEIEAAKQEAEHQITSQRSEYEKEIKSLQSQLVKDQAGKHNLQTVVENAVVLQREYKFVRKKRNVSPKHMDKSGDDVKDQVFASLEAERKKLAEEVERMQQKMSKKHIDKGGESNAVPLRVSLLLQEANNISKTLNKDTRFSLHAASDDQSSAMIKVLNTQLGIWTIWSLDKFEEKVEAMREMYNGAAVDDSSDEFANVFYDPNDDWEEAYNCDDVIIPSPPATVQKKSQRLSRRLSSLVLARASPALQESLSKFNRKCAADNASSSPINSADHLNYCKKLMGTAVSEMKQESPSLIDKLLLTLNEITTVSSQISRNAAEKNDYSISSEFHEESLSVSFSAKTLLFVVSFVRSSVTEIADASLSVEKLLVQLEKASKDLLSHITKLLQGCYNGLQSIVEESFSKIYRLAPNISKCAGAVTIATNLQVNLFNEDQHSRLSHRLKHAFLQGGDTFMRRVLSGGVDRLSKLDKNNNSDQAEHFSNLSSATIRLLQMCMELQQELYDGSLLLHEHSVPVQYYTEYLQRTQSLIREIGLLIHGVVEINKKASEFLNDSATSRLRYEAESLWRPTSRIADLCVKHEGLCALVLDMNTSQTHSNSNNNNSNNNNNPTNSSVLSERLCDGVYEASRSLHCILRDIIELAESESNSIDGQNSNVYSMKTTDGNADQMSPRKKRILPSSPTMLNGSNMTPTSSAFKNTVEKWLQFADRSLDTASTDQN